MDKRCLVLTDQIIDLAKKFPSETNESIKGLVARWQVAENRTIDEYPSASELNNFKNKLRKGQSNSVDNSNQNNQNFEDFNLSFTGQGTQIEIEIPSKQGKILLVVNRKGKMDIFDKYDAESDTYKQSVPISQDIVNTTAKKYLSPSLLTKIGQWGKGKENIEANKQLDYETAIENEIKAMSKQQMFNNIKDSSNKMNIEVASKNAIWSRNQVSKDTRTLYIFTDNTDRNSGSNLIDPNSWYAKKYGKDKHFPKQTTAVLRGLDNTRPISTQRWYNATHKGITGRWTDADIEEFKKVIDEEFKDIKDAWESGNFDKIVLPHSFFNTRISNITKERTPLIYNYLQSKIDKLGQTKEDNKSSKNLSSVTKIISGGQTGVDTIGLQVAKSLGIETGGTAPKGFRRENIADGVVLSDLGLVEISDEEQADYIKRKGKTDFYTARTELNVRNSDGTVYFADNNDSAGKIATERAAKEFNKPFLLNPNINELRHWLRDNNIKILNIAGNRGSKLNNSDEIYETINKALTTTVEDQIKEESINNYAINELNRTEYTTPEEQAKVDRTFTVATRRKRVALLGRLFSVELDLAVEEYTSDLKENIDLAKANKDYGRANQLIVELRDLDRMKVLKVFTPAGIYNRVLKSFTDYISATKEQQIQLELDTINSMKGADKYSEEKKLEAAKKKAAYKNIEYAKIVDNFKALTEETVNQLKITENIILNPTNVIENINKIEEIDAETGEELINPEENIKDGWMTNFREVSNLNSLSKEVRQLLRNMPRLNHKGKLQKDDLGFQEYLDAEYAHAVLIHRLSNMTKSEDLIPMLTTLSQELPWVKQILHTFNKDKRTEALFYQDFRKDFVNMYIQKTVKKSDGTYQVKTIPINTSEGTYYLLEQWRENYESGNPLSDDSVYNTKGEIVQEKADKGLKDTLALQNKVNELAEDGIESHTKQDIVQELNRLLRNIGINLTEENLNKALQPQEVADGIIMTPPIELMLNYLNIIYKGISRGEVSDEIQEDDTVIHGDLINTFGTAYNGIAMLVNEVAETAMESSVREAGKSYYSHVTPNYLNKVIKELQGARTEFENYNNYLNEQYKQYQFFFKDGKWRNDWLRQLDENPDMRKELQHKVMLNMDKMEYSKWDRLDYTLIILGEYMGEPTVKNSNTQFAYYYVPIMSDAPSAEFIRFRKYDNNSERDAEGNKLTYQEIITDRLVDLITQELDRINLVIERSKLIAQGNKMIEPITNFDIIGNKPNGAEFKFLPLLNTMDFNGKSFIETLNELKQSKEIGVVEDFVKEAVNQMMEEGFERDFKTWVDLGLLNENEDGKYKYMGVMGVNKGQSSYNANFANNMLKIKEILGNRWTEEMQQLLVATNHNKAYTDSLYRGVTEQIKTILEEMVITQEITPDIAKSLSNKLHLNNYAKEALRNYYWNNVLATSQIIQLTATDLAFYKDGIDFQKRFKEIHSPALRLYTESEYGRKIEKTIILKDNIIVSDRIKDITEVLDAKIEKGEMSKIDKDMIISMLERVSVTDAQAYRSLSSYRAVMDMSGKWTPELNEAMENFQNDRWDIKDFNVIFQTIKPFLYTQNAKESGVEGYGKMKVGMQNKNSEFLLLAMHSMVGSATKSSEKLRAINTFMEKHDIDVVQFDTSVKHGIQGVIDINNIEGFDNVLDALETQTGIKEGKENPNIVHQLSYEDYGIQTSTPEHIIDTNIAIGTQIRKLIAADIDFSSGLNYKGADWLDTYNKVNAENILQSFEQVKEIFKDNKTLSETLLKEMRGNDRYTEDMKRAVTLDANGEFNIPLFDPIQSQTIQTLLNSIIKSRITKQKIKGGSAYQVSAYGLTDELNIVFEGEGETKRIKYFECYLPAYSKEFYEPLMKEGSNELDISKLPENLRKLIGYRVPTEDKYSMIPLYIKGFLPQQNGSAIMLPKEITTLSGADFDIDKLYIFLPEFNVKKKYNKSAFVHDLIKQLMPKMDNSETKENLENYIHDVINRKIESDNDTSKNIYNTYQINKYKYLIGTTFEKVEYNINKTPAENGVRARNNAIIDMMWEVLTHQDTAGKLLNPGNFDKQKHAASMVTLLQNSTKEELMKELDVKDTLTLLNKISKMSMSALNKLSAKHKVALDPLSMATQTQYHQQNTTGGTLIGIYANHNANHALTQHTDLKIVEDKLGFTLNGQYYTALNAVKNKRGNFISKNTAGFLAVSVDDVKEGLLAPLNQNTFTADATMYLTRLGYEPIEVGVLMNQPIIKDMTITFFRESREGKSRDTIIKEVIERYKGIALISDDITYDTIKNKSFGIIELLENILIASEAEEALLNDNLHHTKDYSIKEFHRNQVLVGTLFTKILEGADILSDIVKATRADTGNGAAGPTIADTQLKTDRLTDLILNQVTTESPKMEGIHFLEDLSVSTDNTIEKNREVIYNAKLPYLQAFHTFGLASVRNLFSKYFPHYNTSFINIFRGTDTQIGLNSYNKYGKLDVKTMNSVYNDLLLYIMTKTPFFGAEIVNGKIITAQEKRNSFINNFPTYFENVLKDNPKIAELDFIKRLKKVTPRNSNISTISFKNVGKLSPNLKETFTRDWQSLLYMEGEAPQFALNLFRYSAFRNGFAFGPDSFIHLAPLAVIKGVNGYIETLRDIVNNQDDYSSFIKQYVRNHLNNPKIVTQIAKTTQVNYLDSDNNPVNSFSVEYNKELATVDLKFIFKANTDLIVFSPMVSIPYKNTSVYYELVKVENKTATYKKVEPLGVPNKFLEYEYNKSVDEMETVIKQDKNINNITSKDIQGFTMYEENNVDDLNFDSNPINNDAYNDDTLDALSQALSETFGKTIIEKTVQPDLTNIPQNKKMRDANDDVIC